MAKRAALPVKDEDPTMDLGAAGGGAATPQAEEEGAGDEEGEEEGPAPQVICTILKNSDGTYQLIAGDEPEEMHEEGTAAAPGSEVAEGEEGEEGEGESPGMKFDSVGALLKGIMDTVKTYDANESGEGSEEENFQAGFAGSAGAMPSKSVGGM